MNAIQLNEFIDIVILGSAQESVEAQHRLVEIGATAIEELLEFLQHEHYKVRAALASVLGRIGDGHAYESLLDLQYDTNNLVRMNAAKAIGSVASEENDLYPILRWLEEEQDALVLMGLIQSLQIVADGRSVSPLVKLLERTDSLSVTYLTIRVLGDLGDPTVINTLQRYTKNDDVHIRDAALYALKKLVSIPA